MYKYQNNVRGYYIILYFCKILYKNIKNRNIKVDFLNSTIHLYN